MNAKSTALVIAFAAIAIALNVVKIPTIFYPGTFFEFSQIPIIIAFMLFGSRTGILVGFLNLVGSLALFPLGNGIIVYPMDFLALLLMFAGVYLASKHVKRSDESGTTSIWRKRVIGLTGFATAFRGGIMPIVDYLFIYHFLIQVVLGITRSEALILAMVPSFILYNALMPLYTIPVAYLIAARVSKYLKIAPCFL